MRRKDCISRSGRNMFLLLTIGGDAISGKAAADLAAILLPSIVTAMSYITME